MRFRRQNTGGQQAADGVGNFFRALAMAPLAEAQASEQAQKAGMQRDLMQSQIGTHLADAAIKEEERKTLAGRPDIVNLMGATRAGMSVPEFMAGISERKHGAPEVGPPLLSAPIAGVGPSGRTADFNDAIMTIFGPAMATPADKTNWAQLANARGEYQDQGVMDQAAAAANAGDYMRSGALSAVRGKKEFTPYAAVGTTGTALNQVTGDQPVTNPGIRALFGDKVGSEIGENKAQAGAAGAQAGASNALTGLRGVQTRNEKIKGGITAADYQAVLAKEPLPSTNKVERESRGAESTDAKTRNAIVAAVERDLLGADEGEIQAEIAKRLARRGIKAPTPSVSKPQAQSENLQAAQKVRADYKAGKITKDQAKALLKPLGFD